MTHAASPIPIDPLRQALARAGLKRRACAAAARALQALWLSSAAALLLIVADAAWPMPPWLRAAGGIAWVAAVVALAWRARPRREDPHRAPLADAQHIEIHHRLRANELLAGLMLTPAAHDQADPFAQSLAQRTVTRGRAAFNRIDGGVVVDRAALRRHGLAALAALAAWAALLLLLPHLIVGGAARFTAPAGDTPPFSFTRIQVSTEPSAPDAAHQRTGGAPGDITVTARLAGRIPPTASLVELDDAGREVRRWPMRRIDRHTFTFTLQALRQSLAIRVDAGGGRSRPMVVHPAAIPAASPSASTSTAANPTQAAADNHAPSQAAAQTGQSPGDSAATAGAGAAAIGDADRPDQAPPSSAATGIARETAATITTHRDLPDAVMRQAPPAYRPLIRQYFDRLASDQPQEPRP